MGGYVNLDELNSNLKSSINYLISDKINVKMPPYNASGGGNNDDTVSIQNAINDCYSRGGGVVKVPFGQYKITSPIILKKNVSIDGDGDNITIFINETNSTCFKYIGVEEAPRLGTRYSNFCIQGGNGDNEIGMRFKNACSYVFSKIKISGQKTGIWISYGNNITLEYCTIEACTYRGLLLGADTGGIGGVKYVDGLNVFGCGFNENLYHIEHTGSESTATSIIFGNHFYSYDTTICSIWASATKGLNIIGNWFELGETVDGITLNVTSIDGTTYGTPYGTMIKGNCFASHGNIFVNIVEGAASEISANSFTNPTTGAIKVSTGAGRTYIGENKYENLVSGVYKLSATYLNLIDSSDRSLIAGRVFQQKAGTISLTADGSNGYAQVEFESIPSDWTKVSCIATWYTDTLTDYTTAPTQISWSQADTITVRFKVAGKTSGKISYIISESN